ncbi:MAG: hypothetical protein EA394_09605 [Bacteroidia bacterium]|nr:MAG: hypothetical protein EA394_09605 [Bacteroidia bacterium]
MKSTIQTLAFGILFLMIPFVAFSQMCNYYLPLVENTGLVYEHYDQRDRLEGSQTITIKQVETEGDRIIATLATEQFDRRNRPQFEAEYNIVCEGNILYIDMESLLNEAMLEGFKDMDMQIEGDGIIFPTDMRVGETLPDASMNISIRSGGMQMAEMQIRITDREVLSKETVTVPAGTFEAFKISYVTHFETRAMGIPIRSRSKSIEYHAENVGLVRSETYNERDRLQGSQVLSRVF